MLVLIIISAGYFLEMTGIYPYFIDYLLIIAVIYMQTSLSNYSRLLLSLSMMTRFV